MQKTQVKHVELSHYLQKERKLQIERLAIYPVVITVYNDNYYLNMDQPSFKKFQSIAKGVSWELFREQQTGWLGPTIVKIKEDQHGIYLADKKYISPRSVYMIVPSNSTINKQLAGLKKVAMVDQEIYRFIVDPFNHTIGDDIVGFDQQLLSGLNSQQKQAIRLAMKKKVAVINGPPGTGKTSVITRLVEIFRGHKMKILVCAPSNVAIDTTAKYILKSCQAKGITRFCSEITSRRSKAELNPVNFPTLLMHVVNRKRDKFFCAWFEQNLNRQLDHLEIVQKDGFTKDQYAEAKEQATIEVMDSTDILCTTTTSSGLKILESYTPGVLIVDEASQIIDPGILIPLTKGVKKVVLFGDVLQLSPTVISNNPALKQTMFYRINVARPDMTIMLMTQYRMHPIIAAFCSRCFYDGKIQDDPSTSNRQSPYPLFRDSPIVVVNCENPEVKVNHSYYNTQEANIVVDLVRQFKQQDLPKVGVLTGLLPQCQILCQKLQKEIAMGLEVKTFDGYQGSQKQYAIISFVRSNPQKQIGFLCDANRANVALSRARTGIILVGNVSTIKATQNPWKYFVEYAEQCLQTTKPKTTIKIQDFPSLTPQLQQEMTKEQEATKEPEEEFPSLGSVAAKKEEGPKGGKSRKRKGKGEPLDIWS